MASRGVGRIGEWAGEKEIGRIVSVKDKVSADLIKPAKAYSLRDLGSNVVGVGVGEKITGGAFTGELAVKHYVVRKLPPAEVPEALLVPAEISGFRTDVEEVGRIVARESHRSRHRPVKAGVSVSLEEKAVGFRYAGTLGCWAKTVSGGRWVALSNNHVLADENRARLGARVVQPGTLDAPPGESGDGDRVGRLLRFKKIDFAGRANAVDAAIASASAAGLVDAEILGVGSPRGTASARRRMLVRKSGRTTGVTEGVVRDVNADIRVGYDRGEAVFKDQIVVSGTGSQPFSAAGDSGSAIIDGATHAVVGLLFAGSDAVDRTFGNPIANVLRALKIRIP